MVSQNKSHEGIKSSLGIVMRSGKVALGFKSTLKSIRKAKAKLIVISNNCPAVWKTQLEYYAMLGVIKTILFEGNNVDLGSSCGKFFRVSCMAVIDHGDSDLLAEYANDK